jgi:hypothetical protein
MKVPNIKDTNVKFPINIPIKYSVQYKPLKNRPLLKPHVYLNFKNMTGN